MWFLGHAAQEALSRIPIIDGERQVGDAKPYFESQHITFPKGSIAIYFTSKHLLIVAAPQETQDLLTFFLD